MTRSLAAAAVFALACWIAGCAASGGGDGSQQYGRRIAVHVENHNIQDAQVYAVQGRHRQALGTVAPDTDTTFTFYWPTQRLRFQVLLLSIGPQLTDEVLVAEGNELRLRIESDFVRAVVQ